MKSRTFLTSTLAILALSFIAISTGRTQEPAVKNGDNIAFLGDSITAQGATNPGGYVQLVINGLETSGVKAAMIPAGVSGNTSKNMLARVDRDVLSKKPAWMTLSCGVNDVWHGADGVPLDQYEQNITSIVDQAQAAGIKVMILTATMIREDQKNDFNQKLTAYNDFLKSLATKKNCLLADLNAAMQKEVSATPHAGNLLTIDGVHMNIDGNIMMASAILKAFGLNDAQMQKVRDGWLDLPNTTDLAAKASITLREYNQLKALAAEQKQTVQDLVGQKLSETIKSSLKTGTQK